MLWLNKKSFPDCSSSILRIYLRFEPDGDRKLYFWNQLQRPEKKWTNWSSCSSQNGCNTDGWKFRFANCYKNNQLVDPYECSSAGEDLVERQNCRFECDVDCVISQWEEWSACPTRPSCGVLEAKRSRRIIQKSSGFGKSCPNISQQSKPCGYRPCVEWKLLDWYACIPYFGSCGAGEQKRKLTCRQNGQLIQRELCEEISGRIEDIFPRSERIQPCYLLCKNEDLKIPWSSWSICESSCESEKKSKLKIRTRIEASPLSMEYKKFTEFENCTSSCSYGISADQGNKSYANDSEVGSNEARKKDPPVKKESESVRIILWIFLFSGNVNNVCVK